MKADTVRRDSRRDLRIRIQHETKRLRSRLYLDQGVHLFPHLGLHCKAIPSRSDRSSFQGRTPQERTIQENLGEGRNGGDGQGGRRASRRYLFPYARVSDKDGPHGLSDRPAPREGFFSGSLSGDEPEESCTTSAGGRRTPARCFGIDAFPTWVPLGTRGSRNTYHPPMVAPKRTSPIAKGTPIRRASRRGRFFKLRLPIHSRTCAAGRSEVVWNPAAFRSRT
jgi:hypothetical protein